MAKHYYQNVSQLVIGNLRHSALVSEVECMLRAQLIHPREGTRGARTGHDATRG